MPVNPSFVVPPAVSSIYFCIVKSTDLHAEYGTLTQGGILSIQDVGCVLSNRFRRCSEDGDLYNDFDVFTTKSCEAATALLVGRLPTRDLVSDLGNAAYYNCKDFDSIECSSEESAEFFTRCMPEHTKKSKIIFVGSRTHCLRLVARLRINCKDPERSNQYIFGSTGWRLIRFTAYQEELQFSLQSNLDAFTS